MKLIICLLLCFLTYSNAYGSSCPPLPSPENMVEDHEHIFVVTLVSVEYIEFLNENEKGNLKGTYKINETIKGTPEGFDYIWANVEFIKYGEPHKPLNNYSSSIMAGVVYIVFANSGEVLIHTACNDTVQRTGLLYTEKIRAFAHK